MATFIGVINASKLFIETDDEGLTRTLYEKLRYESPDFKPNKYSKWDGMIRMFNKDNGTFPYGLLTIVLLECVNYGIKPEIDPSIKGDIKDISREEIQEWVDSLELAGTDGNPISAHDFQVEGLYLCIKYSRYTALAATSAGKSLLQYLLIRFWLETMGSEAKVLLVVPTIQLTHQMVLDFKDYSTRNGWEVDNYCHIAGDSVSPVTRKQIVVCTWQTLVKQDKDFFAMFNFLIGDEAHTFASESLETIANGCINAYQRIGLTGSLRPTEGERLRVIQHFGSVKRLVTVKELQDRGLAALTRINLLTIHHKGEYRKALRENTLYDYEMKLMCADPSRNQLIINLIKTLKGNSLFIFHYVDTHLKVIEELAKDCGKKVFVIHGDIKPEERLAIKVAIEKGDDIILLATFGTTSTGISIKKLHNLVLCHPTKSIIRVLQTVGRMLRLHNTKEIAQVYDLIDVAGYGGRPNHAMNHAAERIAIYKSEQHNTRVLNIHL